MFEALKTKMATRRAQSWREYRQLLESIGEGNPSDEQLEDLQTLWQALGISAELSEVHLIAIRECSILAKEAAALPDVSAKLTKNGHESQEEVRKHEDFMGAWRKRQGELERERGSLTLRLQQVKNAEQQLHDTKNFFADLFGIESPTKPPSGNPPRLSPAVCGALSAAGLSSENPPDAAQRKGSPAAGSAT